MVSCLFIVKVRFHTSSELEENNHLLWKNKRYWYGLPRAVVMAPSCPSLHLDNALRHGICILGDPVCCQELHLMVFVSPFRLRLFYGIYFPREGWRAEFCAKAVPLHVNRTASAKGWHIGLYYRAEWIVQVSQSQLWRQAEILLFRSLRWRAYMYPSSCYEQTEMSRCFSYSTCRELNHKAGCVEAYSQKVSWLIEYLSLARVVSTVLIAFDVSCGEEFLLYFTLLPKKHKRNFCCWENQQVSFKLYWFQGTKLVSLWYPIDIVSGLTHSWLFSFIINCYKQRLTCMIVVYHYLLPWKNFTGMIQCTCTAHWADRDLLCIGVSFHPSLASEEGSGGNASTADTVSWESSKERQLRQCLNTDHLFKLSWLLLCLLEGKDLLALCSSRWQSILFYGTDICKDPWLICNYMRIKRQCLC